MVHWMSFCRCQGIILIFSCWKVAGVLCAIVFSCKALLRLFDISKASYDYLWHRFPARPCVTEQVSISAACSRHFKAEYKEAHL